MNEWIFSNVTLPKLHTIHFFAACWNDFSIEHINATIKLVYSIRILCEKYSYAEMYLSVLNIMNIAVIIIDFWTNDMLSIFI